MAIRTRRSCVNYYEFTSITIRPSRCMCTKFYARKSFPSSRMQSACRVVVHAWWMLDDSRCQMRSEIGVRIEPNHHHYHAISFGRGERRQNKKARATTDDVCTTVHTAVFKYNTQFANARIHQQQQHRLCTCALIKHKIRCCFSTVNDRGTHHTVRSNWHTGSSKYYILIERFVSLFPFLSLTNNGYSFSFSCAAK